MDLFGSWYLTVGLLWLLAATIAVAIVSINPPDREDALLKAMLRDGLDPEHGHVDDFNAPTTVSST